MANEKLRAILVFEIVGRPKEFIEDVMNKFLDRIKDYKGVELLRKEVLPAEPFQAKSQNISIKDVFSSIAECEFFFKNLETLLGFMLDTMPASIEIVEPSELTLDLPRLNAFINDYLTKIHQYDDVYKKLKLEKEILLRKIAELEKSQSRDKEEKVSKK
ncbi:MAG: hypothetical protein QXS07_01095 [Candidatus Pacearchaeota archaeon]